jgi:hypothetical protein
MRHHLLVRSCLATLVLAAVSSAAFASAVQSGAGTIDVSIEQSGSRNFPSASFPIIFPGSAKVEWRGRDPDYGDAGLGQARYNLVNADDSATFDVHVSHDNVGGYSVYGGRTEFRLDFTTDRDLRYHVFGDP